MKLDFTPDEIENGVEIENVGGHVQSQYTPVVVDYNEPDKIARQGTEKNIETDWMRLD
ncbi:MAG: hypothetical protein GY841_04335 [FCB group bacterium]|nr:hypothetical protein [FCB group bacterium]